MHTERRCEKCGVKLAAFGPAALCPNCMLREAIGCAAHPNAQPPAAGDGKGAPVVPAPVTEKPGDIIGHYRLLQQIGEGGMGIVYLAEQEQPVRRRVALKVIKLGLDTKSVIARFEAERQALALMDHPNIAKVLDAGATDAGRPYFVMELVHGTRITDYCDDNQCSTAQRLGLFTQICRAIQHAHQKGIIHRDIKPSNILVSLHDGVPLPKIIDFGISKATSDQQLTDKTLFTALEQFIGTPSYMSPEQAERRGLDIDTRSDIYSLGVLLYELLTGQTPFEAKELLAAGLDAMRRTIREKEPPKPSTRLSQELAAAEARRRSAGNSEPSAPSPRKLQEMISLLRGDLDWIVMKALEKDRARRYESANGLAMDIQRHLNNEPVLARPPSATYRFQKMVRRHKIAFAATSAVVAALVVGLGISTWMFIQERAARQRAVAAEQKARAAATKSEHITRLLEEMLAGVGPSVALGRDTKMLREILDKAAAHLSEHLQGQPEVEAELRNTIGEVYRALGSDDKAEVMHRQALAARRRLWGNTNLAVAESLDNLGMALWGQNKLSEAEPLYLEGLAIRTNLLGNAHPAVATSLNNLGCLAQSQGKYAEAEALHRRVLAVRRELFPKDHPDKVESLVGLASALWNLGKLQEAETLNLEALELRRRLSGDDLDPIVPLILNNLATVLMDEAKPEEGEARLRESVAIWKKLLGDESPQLAQAIHNLAIAHIGRGNLKVAEAGSREALAMRRKLLNHNHPDVVQSLGAVAVVVQREGRFAEAETLQREHLALSQECYGKTNRFVATSLNNLSRVLRSQGRLPEAESVQREALTLQQALLPDPHAEIANSLHNLGDLYRDQGKLAEAEAAHRQALAMLRQLLGDEHLAIASSLDVLARVLCDEDKWAEAEGAARESLGIWEKKRPDDWRAYSAKAVLGASLLGLKHYDEAGPALLSGYTGMEQRMDKIAADYRTRVNHTAVCLVQLFEATGRSDQAAEWKQKLEALRQPAPATNAPVNAKPN